MEKRKEGRAEVDVMFVDCVVFVPFTPAGRCEATPLATASGGRRERFHT